LTDSKFNRLFKYSGKLPFIDITEQAGISQWAAQYTSWGTGAYDYDNDGLTDLLVFHGGLIHLIAQEHSVFRNLGGGKFEDVSSKAGPYFATKSVARGACFADYNNEGKVGAFVVNLGAPGVLLHNVTQSTGHWLTLSLVGTKSNRDGIGAKVTITAGELIQRSQRVAGSGYLSQDDWRLHFGLGSHNRADKITIAWPSGIQQTLENVAADQILTVTEKCTGKCAEGHR
jgi:hypothetical protein